jgi:glycosyltransferase involved in cell wall biosynthesis
LTAGSTTVGAGRTDEGKARRLRVLMLTGFPAIGGPLPKLAPLVADGLTRCGCDVAIQGWSAHTAGHESVAAKVLGRARDLLRVHRRLRAWRPDVIYVATSHNWPALLRDIPLVTSVALGHPPLIVHLHGSESHQLGEPGRRLFKACSYLLVRRSGAVLLLSTEEKREWTAFCPQGRFEVVDNPFVPASARPVAASPAAVDERQPVLLTVARLIAQKGVFDLLDAFAMVRRQRPARLLIAGTGPASDDLERRVHLMGLDASVDLLGYVSGVDLDRAYGDAAAFVLPSYFAEGFPLAVMEAMSYGLPVVTTAIRGCADHLRHGEHALFVPARDPRALAEQLVALLDDGPLRARMGAANVAKIAEFAPDVVVPRYAEILRSVVAAQGGFA